MYAGLNSLALRLASQQESSAAPATTPAERSSGIVGIHEFYLDPSNRENLLGMGSFACVHKATRKSDGAPFAIKVFHRPVSRGFNSPSNSAHGGKAFLARARAEEHEASARELPRPKRADRDPRRISHDTLHMEDADSFKTERRLLADSALNHRHILAYLGYGFVPVGDDGKLAGFLVTGFVPGIDLYRVLQRSRSRSAGSTSSAPLDASHVLRWSSQLASALAHMHAHGVMHRDVKETNLMVSDAPGSEERGSRWGNQDLVLLDLGLAMRIATPGPRHDVSSVTTSRDLAAGFGIIGYRAPEVHRKQPYSLSVDVFAFGKVLYNMLGAICNRPPRASIAPRKLCAQLVLAVCPRGTRGGWGYESVYCKPPVSIRWPVALAVLALDCLNRDPSVRPSAESISKTLAEIRL